MNGDIKAQDKNMKIKINTSLNTKYTFQEPSYLLYRQNKDKYKMIKTHQNASNLNSNHNADQNTGLMVMAPMGTGKSYYINNLVPPHKQNAVIDGDVLLEKHNVKNRNYYWYDDTKHKEREAILKVFEQELSKGKIILYSGNPQYIKTDVLVVPNKNVRWDRLQSRDDYKPSRMQFDREQLTYEQCREVIPIIFNSDIPQYEILESIKNAKDKI